MEDKEYIEKATSKTLAAHIVVYRSLGINKELSILCMEELLRRKENGDNFNYDEYILNELEQIPKLNQKEQNLMNTIMNMNFKDFYKK